MNSVPSPAEPESDWTKTPYANLIRYEPSKKYFARLRVKGKLIRRSLKTTVLSVAKLRLADLEKAERGFAASQEAVAEGKMTFGDCLEVFKTRLATDPVANATPLDEHELYLLDKAAVHVEGNERFFTMAKAMLPRSKFLELLHEAKSDEMEGRAAQKTPTARLIWRIISAIKSPNSIPLSLGAGLDN
jgi:hypothetical protein